MSETKAFATWFVKDRWARRSLPFIAVWVLVLLPGALLFSWFTPWLALAVPFCVAGEVAIRYSKWREVR